VLAACLGVMVGFSSLCVYTFSSSTSITTFNFPRNQRFAHISGPHGHGPREPSKSFEGPPTIVFNTGAMICLATWRRRPTGAIAPDDWWTSSSPVRGRSNRSHFGCLPDESAASHKADKRGRLRPRCRERNTFDIAGSNHIQNSSSTAFFFANLRQGRSDQGSLLCSTQPRSPSQTPLSHRRIRRLPRVHGVESSNRTQDRPACRST